MRAALKFIQTCAPTSNQENDQIETFNAFIDQTHRFDNTNIPKLDNENQTRTIALKLFNSALEYTNNTWNENNTGRKKMKICRGFSNICK